MSFLALHRDKEHKFKNGLWTWGEHEEKLKFHPHGDDKKTENETHSVVDAGLQFKAHIDVAEEKIFRGIFLRPNSFYDGDVVTLQDIKNLVLFTSSSMTPQLIDFLLSEAFDKFLHSIIFYTDLFLMILELLLIRRDKELQGFVRDTHSVRVEQFLSKQLSDRRLLIARDYSKAFFVSDRILFV